MRARCLWALLILGCSSSSHSANRSSSGGSPGTDGDSGVYTGDNSQCPQWPQERLFPWVGPFFYGPDRGPCSYTETDRPSGTLPKIFTLTFTYDSDGLLTQAATAVNDHNIQYTYDSTLLHRADDFEAGPLYRIAYFYGTDSAGYTSQIDADPKVVTYEYALDSNGYPKTLSYSAQANGQDVTPTDTGVRFVYDYENCRIVKRRAFTLDGTEYPLSTADFTYDDVGHLVDINAPNFDYSFDYACWSPPDAGPQDAGP